MIRRCILTVALLAAVLVAAGCDDANKAGPTGPQETIKRGGKKEGGGTLPKPPAIEPAN
ncbi:MAG: hypothetical protein K2X82_12755 [Gemmataceae bacterium]|nr:hypothetical protein [Gemmataceae bacterium]